MALLFVTHDIGEPVHLAERVVTRSDPRFIELRGHVYAQVQKARHAGATHVA
jgi:ABC-type nitrate/sulfonate/bicarbonate transport system ATPase subunit